MILDPNGVARSAGVAARTARGQTDVARARPAQSSDGLALLLFRAAGEPARTRGAAQPDCASGSHSPQQDRAQRERLPDAVSRQADAAGADGRNGHRSRHGNSEATQAVLVFSEGERTMGLMVDEIIDVVHGRLDIELGSTRPGLLGTAIIAGQAADVLDTGYWLTSASRDWFKGGSTQGPPAAASCRRGQRLLPPHAGPGAQRPGL